MPDDKVLIEIITAANMAGVEQANKGLLGLSGPILAVGAALGIGIDIAKKAEEQYVSLGESVHRYMKVTGESAETSSRQINAFKDLGVTEDAAEAAMAKLSKAIETTPKKLHDLNIETAKTSAGNVDLNATLYNVIDAWNGTEDAAKRNYIALTAFGRGGVQAMLPILQAGSNQLRQLEADAKLVMTEKDVEQVHKYAISQKRAQDSWDSLMTSMGRGINSVVAPVTEAFNKEIYVAGKVDEANQKLGAGHYLAGKALQDLRGKLGDEYDALQAAAARIDEFKYSTQQAADEQEKLAKAVDDAVNAIESEANDAVRVARDQLKMEEAVGKVDQAQDDYNKTVQRYGPASEEAMKAHYALRGAMLDQKQAYLDAAGAAQKLAEDEAGPGVSATDKATAGHKAFLAKLQEEANKLAPGSDLRNYLQQYIDEINAASTAASNANADITGGIGGGARHFARGGNPRTGETGWVGEEGPELVTFGAGATVHPAGTGRGGSNGSGGGTYIDLRGAFLPDGPSIDRLANLIARRLSYTTGR